MAENFSKDGTWKVEGDAWKNDFLVYKSLGVEGTVYHKETTSSVWGGTSESWVETAPGSLTIEAVFSGSGPGTATQRETKTGVSFDKVEVWAFGGSIKVDNSGNVVGGGASEAGQLLKVDSVKGNVSAVIGPVGLGGIPMPGSEVVSVDVSAGNAVTDMDLSPW